MNITFDVKDYKKLETYIRKICRATIDAKVEQELAPYKEVFPMVMEKVNSRRKRIVNRYTKLFNKKQCLEMRKMHDNGVPYREIATMFMCSKTTVKNYVHKYNINDILD